MSTMMNLSDHFSNLAVDLRHDDHTARNCVRDEKWCTFRIGKVGSSVWGGRVSGC